MVIYCSNCAGFVPLDIFHWSKVWFTGTHLFCFQVRTFCVSDSRVATVRVVSHGTERDHMATVATWTIS